jgi:hypothetical protein
VHQDVASFYVKNVDSNSLQQNIAIRNNLLIHILKTRRGQLQSQHQYQTTKTFEQKQTRKNLNKLMLYEFKHTPGGGYGSSSKIILKWLQ